MKYCFAKRTRSFRNDRKWILSSKTCLLGSCWIYISWQLQGIWSISTKWKVCFIAVFYKVNIAQKNISLEKLNSNKKLLMLNYYLELTLPNIFQYNFQDIITRASKINGLARNLQCLISFSSFASLSQGQGARVRKISFMTN